MGAEIPGATGLSQSGAAVLSDAYAAKMAVFRRFASDRSVRLATLCKALQDVNREIAELAREARAGPAPLDFGLEAVAQRAEAVGARFQRQAEKTEKVGAWLAARNARADGCRSLRRRLSSRGWLQRP